MFILLLSSCEIVLGFLTLVTLTPNLASAAKWVRSVYFVQRHALVMGCFLIRRHGLPLYEQPRLP